MSDHIIDWIGGNCPVQAEGVIHGYKFYFRARGQYWSFEVYNGESEPWSVTEKYSDEPYAAGWMTKQEATSFIQKATNQFSMYFNSQVDSDDGQPDEQQEWRDYDPDC